MLFAPLQGAENDWLVTYVILLPPIPALLMTSLTQTAPPQNVNVVL